MANSEVHRQFYLEAAGIRMWYAKKPLPGAAPSPEFWFPEEDKVESPVSADVKITRALPEQKAPADQSGKEGAARSVNLQALMESPGTGKQPESEPTRPESTPSSEASNVIEPPVQDESSHTAADSSPELNVGAVSVQAHLALWATDRYLLVSQWSGEASEQLQDSLANNVLKALGEQSPGERRNLQWPVFRGSGIPGNSTRDFQGVLAQVVSADLDKSIILLGVMAEESKDLRSAVLAKLLSPKTLDFPRSLAVLSTSPGYKRDLWSALKARFPG